MSNWVHRNRYRYHEVPELTATRWHDGASLCTVCWGEVDLAPAREAELQDSIDRKLAAYHSLIASRGTMGPAYGPCNRYCTH